jgi:hypothetical protein
LSRGTTTQFQHFQGCAQCRTGEVNPPRPQRHRVGGDTRRGPNDGQPTDPRPTATGCTGGRPEAPQEPTAPHVTPIHGHSNPRADTGGQRLAANAWGGGVVVVWRWIFHNGGTVPATTHGGERIKHIHIDTPLSRLACACMGNQVQQKHRHDRCGAYRPCQSRTHHACSRGTVALVKPQRTKACSPANGRLGHTCPVGEAPGLLLAPGGRAEEPDADNAPMSP